MQTRRKFIKQTGKGLLVTTLGGHLLDTQNIWAVERKESLLNFKQEKLPYGFGDLAPYIDERTMEIHYTKHHATYVKLINEAILAENISEPSVEALFKRMANYSAKARNNAGGAWNHNFFWENLTPNTIAPSGKLADGIRASFGSFEQFKEQFTKVALNQFGSGWAWLVDRMDRLEITSTPNQDNPLMDLASVPAKPLLGLDVWEHAYYLKYQNRRQAYIDNWWHVVNWEKVTERLG
ncbi:superoxide dismutase [Olivibacter sp. CPCC 100613]|uniref:superoxide dismutase n=1 Tax=Olivibacter sp. CPCC 100613 TaxID=3079931 RepID=UPI002FF8158D